MKRIAPTLVFLFFATLAFAFGFSARDVWSGRAPDLRAFARLTGRDRTETPPEVYQRHFDLISSRYVRQIAVADLRHAAMEGLVATLGDPHTNYFEPVAAERFSTESHGDFVGVGARLSDDPLGAKVATVFENGPAFNAGLKVNDVIIAVDGKKVAGIELTEIVNKIRGPEGTSVTLSINRAGDATPHELKIVRRRVEIPSAEGKLLPGNVAYISVSNFAEPTPKQFGAALDKAIAAKANGLVIDMRGNPGGLLESAVEMLSKFAAKQTVVTMKFRRGQDRKETSSGDVVNFPRPIAILVDEDSASAAEIFSGCMRDYKLAKLVGIHTYGKTSVQNVHSIPDDGSSIKITVAKYYLPSGVNFDRKVDEDGTYLSGGLQPDFKVEMPVGQPVVIGDPEKDPQLKKAMEVVAGKA